jgi:cyclopropane fatty-acyl-phospholipid synthase-like methyltransferase
MSKKQNEVIQSGDTCKVIANKNFHHFDVGDEVYVKVARPEKDSYICANDNDDHWALSAEELRKIKE